MDTNPNVVKDEMTTQRASEAKQQEVLREEVKQPAQPGSKTEPTDLLKSLQEERERRRVAEDKAKLLEEELTIKSSNPSDDVFSDEGKLIVSKYVEPLKSTINSLEDRLALKDLQLQYPVLRETLSEFEDFRKDYPRHKLDNVAKLFLVEKGLLDSQRKGLEKSTGGDRTPIKTGLSTEEVKNLRLNNPKKYREMLKNDQIRFE